MARSNSGSVPEIEQPRTLEISVHDGITVKPVFDPKSIAVGGIQPSFFHVQSRSHETDESGNIRDTYIIDFGYEDIQDQ